MIAVTLQTVEYADGAMTRSAAAGAIIRLPKDLRYGENPHQKAQWVPNQAAFLPPWEIHQGKELSYTNLLDLDAALRIALEFPEPVGVVIKHTNPCGVALGATIADAYVRAREADPLSAFGGIVGLNRTLDAETARALTSTFIEAVIAPAVADEARPILATKANLRVATADFVEAGRARPDQCARHPDVPRRHADAGSRRRGEAHEPWPHGEFPKVVTKRAPTAEEWIALRFAWRVCGHVKSNAVIFTNADRTLAVGAGQMSRVDAVKVAVMKAAGTLAQLGGGLRRVLPVPRRPRRRGRRRRDRGRAARRLGARRRGHRRRRRARPRDGVHRQEALPALSRSSESHRACPVATRCPSCCFWLSVRTSWTSAVRRSGMPTRRSMSRRRAR